MSTPLTLALLFLGFFTYLFVFWRRLKDDYASPLIFVSSFFQLVLIILIYFAANRFLAPKLYPSELIAPQGLWFWAVIASLFVSQIVIARLTEMKYYEVFEASALSSLYLLIAFFLGKTLFLGAGLSLGLVALYYFLDHNYKRFAWYRSGKVGFSALTTLAIFFLVRALVAFIAPEALLLFGKIDTIISSLAAMITFASLYQLAESQKQ